MSNSNSTVVLAPAILIVALLLAVFPQASPARQEGEETGAAVKALSQASAGVDSAELGRLVETAVEKRIRPLAREIRDLGDEIRLHDILGGIGYIIGLAGLAFYFLGVRKRRGVNSGIVE